MKISHHNYEHISVFTLSGECTADDVDQFARAVNDRKSAGAKHILLDCENLEFVDSKGLEAWLDVQESIGSEGGQLRLVNPDEALTKILELTRLDLAFEAHTTIEDAIRSLR